MTAAGNDAVTGGPDPNDPDAGGTEDTPSTGFVYVMSNQETGNSVTVFHREVNGDLTRLRTFPTGGLGVGKSYDLEQASDAVGSQGSLVMSPDRRFLFGVDAGSDTISSLAIDGEDLVLVDRVPSGGFHPVSLTVHENLLFVANTGGPPPNEEGDPDATISGYTVDPGGRLTPIAGSIRALPGGPLALPSQISFNPAGTLLAVTERQTNFIDVFPVDAYGRPGDPVRTPSNGPAPFTCTFHGPDVLLSTEVVGVNFMLGAVSSYRVAPTGQLTVISGSVNTTEIASCWSADSLLDPDVTYIANAQSGTVSAVRFDENGAITPFPPDGHLVSTRDSRATQDMAITSDGRFLYVITGGFDEKLADPRVPTFVEGTPFSNRMSISAFRIESSAALTPLRGFAVADEPPEVSMPGFLVPMTGLAPGSQGIVAT